MSQSFLWQSAERITGLWAGDEPPTTWCSHHYPNAPCCSSAGGRLSIPPGKITSSAWITEYWDSVWFKEQMPVTAAPLTMPAGFIFLPFPWEVSAEVYLNSCSCVVVYYQTSQKLTLLACLAVVLLFPQIGLARRNNQVHAPTVNWGIKKTYCWSLKAWKMTTLLKQCWYPIVLFLKSYANKKIFKVIISHIYLKTLLWACSWFPLHFCALQSMSFLWDNNRIQSFINKNKMHFIWELA